MKHLLYSAHCVLCFGFDVELESTEALLGHLTALVPSTELEKLRMAIDKWGTPEGKKSDIYGQCLKVSGDYDFLQIDGHDDEFGNDVFYRVFCIEGNYEIDYVNDLCGIQGRPWWPMVAHDECSGSINASS